MATTCADPANSKTYVLGTSEPKFAQVGLVRQGVTMTQISVTALEWRDSTTSELLGPCAGFVPTEETAPWGAWPSSISRSRSSGNCNQNYGGGSWPCLSQFPKCVGFVQGLGWGSCYDECLTEGGDTELWVEISVWGDSVSLVVAWDNAFQLPAGCTGTVDLAIDSASDGLSASRSTALSTGAGSVSAFFTVPQQGSDPSQSAALLADDDVRQLRHHFGPSPPHFPAACHPAYAVFCVLIGAQAYRMPIGAWNLTLRPMWGCRPTRPRTQSSSPRAPLARRW